MAVQGIIFDVESENDFPTNIPYPLVRLGANAEVDPANPTVVLLHFTFRIQNAEISEKPKVLGKRAWLPFEEGTHKIELGSFIQKQNPKSIKFTEDTAQFTLDVDWPDGKIGGAGAFAAKHESETYEAGK